MRFLDLDLDFFLNVNAYCSGSASGRLSSKYKPWSVFRVRHFLEERCGLSRDVPVQGRTVKTHNGVFDFWRTLIQSGSLAVPFDLIHVDAHPDLWICDGLYLISDLLHFDCERVLKILSRKNIHQGNYLTFAMAYGWIGSLVWVSLDQSLNNISKCDGDTKSTTAKLGKKKDKRPDWDLPAVETNLTIPFKVLPWHKFKTRKTFDYITFSRSPEFTPPESDALIPVIEEYIKQM